MKKNNTQKNIKDYPSLDDWFVDKYLRHEEETIEEAKERVKKEQEEAKKKKEKENRKKDK